MILALLACSAILAHFFAMTTIPQIAANWFATLPLPKELVMVVILLFYLLGGSFMDDVAL